MPIKPRTPEQLAVYNLLRRLQHAKVVCVDFRTKSRDTQLEALYTVRDLLHAADETCKLCMIPAGINAATQKAAAKHYTAAYDLARDVARVMPTDGEFFWVARDIRRMITAKTQNHKTNHNPHR